MKEQFYALTLERAISDYLFGDITAKGLIHFYIKLRCKPGWKIHLDFKELCGGTREHPLPGKLPISKSCFYKAISDLASAGKIAWEAVKGFTVTFLNFNSAVSEESEETPEILEPELQTSKPQEPEPAEIPAPAIATTPTKTAALPFQPRKRNQDAYKEFLKDLPPNHKQPFQEFANTSARNLPNPPTLPKSWIAANFEELYARFKESLPGNNPTLTDFSEYPNLEQCLAAMRQDGCATWVETGTEPSDSKMRMSLFKWAHANDLI